MTDSPPIEPPPKPSRSRQAVIRWAALLCAAAFIVLLLNELIGSTWPITLLSPLTPQWAMAGFLGAVLLFVARRPRGMTRPAITLVTAGLLAAAWGGAISFELIPWHTLPPLTAVAIADPKLAHVKVMAANVHSENTDYQALVKLIEDESPDIIVLTEVNDEWAKHLRPFNGQYILHTVRPDSLGNFGMALFCRYPGKATWTTLNAPSADVTPQVDVVCHFTDDHLQVRAIHLLGLHPLPPLVPHNTVSRDAVLAEAAAMAAKHEEPFIIAGDLNSTRYCRIAQQFRKTGMFDAMASMRVSWPNTWSWPITGIRIDHILASDDWRLIESHAGRPIGSDHLPMVATLQLVK